MAFKCSQRADVLRILLIGRTGQGKSFTGNSIVGQQEFTVAEKHKSKSETKTCSWSGPIKIQDGRIVEVVDTPGIFDTEYDPKETHKELLKSLALTVPGFHAIAYVLQYGTKITDEFKKTQEIFFDWFGPGVEKLTFVILTCCKSEDEKNKYLYDDPQKKLTELMEKCGDRCAPIENTLPETLLQQQVSNILNIVEQIKVANGNACFTNPAYQLALSYIRNSYSTELTLDSLIMINDVAPQSLTETQRAVLSTSFDNFDETQWTYVDAGSNSTDPGTKVGNVPIFDTSTNTKIPNVPATTRWTSKSDKTIKQMSAKEDIVQKNRIMENSHVDIEQQAASDESQVCDKNGEKQVIGKVSEMKESEKGSTLRAKNMTPFYYPSRRNRNVDKDSISFETPPSKDQRPENTEIKPTTKIVEKTNADKETEFKKGVNNDDKELNRLQKFIRKVRDLRCSIL